MRCLLPTFFVLALTLSCSEPPSVQQAQVPAVEMPAVEVQAESQTIEPPIVEKTHRLAVGDQAPNFQLQDQDGTERTLDSLLAEGKVAVVFHRSADW